MPLVQGGKIRACSHRIAALGAAARGAEHGRGWDIEINIGLWSGLFVPVGTPPAIVKKIDQAVHLAMADQGARQAQGDGDQSGRRAGRGVP